MPQREKPGEPLTRPEPTEISGDLDQKIIRAMAAEAAGQGPPSSRSPMGGPSLARPAIAFRPLVRPPVAELTVCDAGRPDGETIRIRSRRFVIGRTEGDLKIEIDGRISARHAEITLQTIAGRHHRWVLTDLQSTHGLFVRVSRLRLQDQSEFLVGGGRYRFDAARHEEGGPTELIARERTPGQTDAWVDDTTSARPAALTELIGNDIGGRVLLTKPEYWIGSDPACPICRPDDPFCEPWHIRLSRTPKGFWQAENNKTQNGLWVRMAQVAVESLVHFQIGEQRFRLRVK